MTKADFLSGYLLLVIQPWGRRYELSTSEGQLQSELYYRHLSFADVETWRRVAERFAQGGKWPSLEELKQSLYASLPRRRSLPAPEKELCPDMPPDVRKRIDALLGRAGKSMPGSRT